MTFLAPFGLFALLAVPAVLALHYFRRRLRERRAAALFLFGDDLRAPSAGRTKTTLLRSPSLWCELAAAALLGLLLGAPSCDADASRRHVVIVLDDSASMGALHQGVSGADRARIEAARLIDEVGRDGVVTIMTTGERPEILFGPRGAAALADDALKTWTPRRPRHDPALAAAFGVEVAGVADRVVFITDEPSFSAPFRVETIGIGVAAPNAAILSAKRVRLSATEERVYADVALYGGGPTERKLRLYSGMDANTATLLAETTLSLTPGAVARASFLAPRSTEAWRLALEPDALAVDDEAPLLPEPDRVVRVANLLSDETSKDLALDRALRVLEGAAPTRSPIDADLVFAASPGKLERGVVECVIGGAPTADAPRSDWIGPYFFDRRHPMTTGLSLQGVVWSAFDGAVAGAPLVLAGDQPLLTEETGADGARIRLNIDPKRSNLPNAPDWPVLLSNILDRVRRGLPGPVAVNVRVGEEMTWRVRGGTDDPALFSIRTPDGRILPGRGLRLVGFVGDRPGIYVLKANDREIGRFAVRFADARESDLVGLSTESKPATTPPRADADMPGRDGGGRRERRALLVLFLAAVALDWWFLRRGRGS